MTIPYERAVTTIYECFQGKVEREVVCTVLEANNGHMERTIECILNLLDELPSTETATIEAIQESTSKQNQIHEDEIFAQMVQDQFFISQLKSTPEWNTFFPEHKMVPTIPPFGGSSANPEITLNSNTAERIPENFDFGEKFKQMGEAAKSKFREFAVKFRATDRPDVKYSVCQSEDHAEVIELDSSLTRRTTINFEDDFVLESEIPLSKKSKGSKKKQFSVRIKFKFEFRN